MKRILYICTLTLFGFGIVSCVKDKGNYEYSDVNSVSYGEFTRSYAAQPGDVVTVTPVVTTSAPAANDSFTYQWYYYPSGSSNNFTVLSNEKVLNLPIEGRWTNTGTHEVFLRIRNNRTGLWYRMANSITIKVTSPTERGFLFLVKNGNDIGIDMGAIDMTDSSSLKVVHNVHNMAEEGKRIETTDRVGRNILAYQAWPAASARYNILVLTDKSTDIIDSKTFGYVNNLASTVSPLSKFISNGDNVVPDRMMTMGLGGNTTGRNNAFYYEGNWYWWTEQTKLPCMNPINLPCTSSTDPVFLAPKAENLFPVSKYAALSSTAQSNSNCGTMVIWSESEKRFLFKRCNVSIASVTPMYYWFSSYWLDDAAHSSESTIDVFKYKGNYRMIHMGARSGTHNTNGLQHHMVYAIVYDNESSKYRMLTMDIQTPTGQNIIKAAYNMSANVDDVKETTDGTKMFVTSYSYDYIYYVTNDNRLYSYMLTGGQERDLTSQVCPAGHQIVAFRSFEEEYPTNLANLSTRFYVITKDTSLPEDSCCTLTVYEKATETPDLELVKHSTEKWNPESGKFDLQVPFKFEGIGDVTAFTFKYKN